MQDELHISVLSYSIFMSCSYAFFVLNFINSVLEKFRNSKLVLNHNFNLLFIPAVWLPAHILHILKKEALCFAET
jgi:hypothetical protein